MRAHSLMLFDAITIDNLTVGFSVLSVNTPEKFVRHDASVRDASHQLGQETIIE